MYTIVNSITGVKINLTTEEDRGKALCYLPEQWKVWRPSLGSMTYNDWVKADLERLGYGKGCQNRISAIRFLRSMTGAGLKETKDFFEKYVW